MPFSSDALNVGVCGPLLRAAIQFDFLIVAFQVPIQQPAPMRASISCRFLCAGCSSTPAPTGYPGSNGSFLSHDNELRSKRSSMTTTHRWHQQRIWFIKSWEKKRIKRKAGESGNGKSANHFRVKGPTKSAIRFPFRFEGHLTRH